VIQISNDFRKDLQNSNSSLSIAIDKVGITGLIKRIDIVRGHYKYSFYPKISALISLPANQRGIHMSRSSETIDQVINEVIFKPTPSIEVVTDRIVKRLLEKHPYTEKIHVELEGDVIVQVRESEKNNIQKSYSIKTIGEAKKLNNGEIEFKYFISASALGITVCPCAKEMSMEYAEDIIKARKDLKISEEDIKKLLNILPFSSHNQRAQGVITVEIDDVETNYIDIMDLVNIIENSMSGKVSSVLKRPEEAELVRSAHLNPLFAEDAVREMAKNFIKRDFPNLKDEFRVNFEITSFESIHSYDVFAELNTTVGELKKAVKRF
jgi:GTP cyclohydrolase-4